MYLVVLISLLNINIQRNLFRAECTHCLVLPSLPSHIPDKHSSVSSRLQCNKCSYSSAQPDRLEVHSQKCHLIEVLEISKQKRFKIDYKKRKQCPVCGIFMKNLSEHQKMVHNQVKRFICDFCNYSCYFKVIFLIAQILKKFQSHLFRPR